MKFKEKLKRSVSKRLKLDRNRNVHKLDLEPAVIKDAAGKKDDERGKLGMSHHRNRNFKNSHRYKREHVLNKSVGKSTTSNSSDNTFSKATNKAKERVCLPVIQMFGDDDTDVLTLVKPLQYKPVIKRRLRTIQEGLDDESEDFCNQDNDCSSEKRPPLQLQAVNLKHRSGVKLSVEPLTCGDIYGNYETESITFGLSPVIQQSVTKHSQNITEKKSDEILEKREHSCQPKIVNTNQENDKENVIRDVLSAIKESHPKMAITKTLSSGNVQRFKDQPRLDRRSSLRNPFKDRNEVNAQDTGESFENPWILRSDANNKSERTVHDNKLGNFTDVVDKPMNMLKPYENQSEERQHSFGFDVSHIVSSGETNIVNEDIIKNDMLVRSSSHDSLDSFGSSVHSVHSNELFFSDSEAEHDVDQIENGLKENVRNNSTNSANNKTCHTVKDSESVVSGQVNKQIIPYSLSENIMNDRRDSKRKGGKMRSRSVEGNINEITKNVLAIIDGHVGTHSSMGFSEGLKKSISVDNSADRDQRQKKKTTPNRRSLDSSLKSSEILSHLENGGKRRSMLASSTELPLSPVLEAEGKVLQRVENGKSELDPTRFYTLPNPKKLKSSQSPRRKVGRIGSLSQLLNDKAHSISHNIRLGSSFKIRNENSGDKMWAPLSLSANSLANKVVKKASDFSTMIRRRTSSATLPDSPFKEYTKKRSKVKDENKVELVYEKVEVTFPRKRPVTQLEKKSQEKRLKLNIKLANDFVQNELDPISLDSRSRTNSLVLRQRTVSGHQVQSPTLLDEIMRSVDTAEVRRLCSIVDNNDDLSSDHDSSSGSSIFLFQKQYSMDTELSVVHSNRASIVFTFCRSCGKVRNFSDSSADSCRTRDNSSNAIMRPVFSLCDLTAKCNCSKKQNCGIVGNVTSGKAERKSWDIMTRNNCLRKNQTGDVRPRSMYDLCTKAHVEERVYSGSSKNKHVMLQKSESLTGITQGGLSRIQPVLDLSADDLEQSVDSDSEVVEEDDDVRKTQSCNDLLDREIEMEQKAGSLKRKVKAFTDEDASWTSSVDILEDLQSAKSDIYVPEALKCSSCGDLINSSEFDVGESLKITETNNKKESRMVKVKSMSSSHDVLTNLVAMETIDIDDVCDDFLMTMSNNVQFTSTPASTSSKAETKVISSDTRGITCQCNRSLFKDLNDKMKTAETNNSDVENNGAPLTTKPPLPFKKKQNKVLSLSDIYNQEKKDSESVVNRKTQRFSMVEYIQSADKENDDNCGSDIVNLNDVYLGKGTCTPKSSKLTANKKRQFLFDDKHIRRLVENKSFKSISLTRQRSVSSDEVSNLENRSESLKRKLLSTGSLSRLSGCSCSDDVFTQLSANFSPTSPLKACPEFSNQFFVDPKFKIDLPPFHSSPVDDKCAPFGVEHVLKYDVCLGYLLHTLECDDMTVCVYSLQRNKQIMESVINPLAAVPEGSPKRNATEKTGPTKKGASKQRPEEMPNPAAPITQVPSDRLVHAGHVLRTVLLTRVPHMIRDRKFHLRTYRRCMVGTEMVDWVLQHSGLVHSRTQAIGMWQALVEEGVVVHVCHEHQFKDKYLFYRFHEDDEGESTVPSTASKRECEDELQDVFLMLAQIGPDAMMRMILRKPSHERTSEDLEIIYEELLHIKALSHLSTMVKRELASVLVFESHAKAGTVLFNQGDEGKSWYIILKGSVNVVIYGKGVVCTLHEGDDFGKLALVNDAPRAATIVLRDDNCHFLRVDKDDFNRILGDVEANTVRLKEHGQDVLVLEKIPSNTQAADGTLTSHYKYSVMAGTPEKMLEHLLDSRLDNKNETEIDGFLEDFLLTHVIFMPCNHLCPVLLSHYHSSTADGSEHEGFEFMLNHKKCVLHFVQEWAKIIGAAFREDATINAFLKELHSCVKSDLQDYPTLKDDLKQLETILNTQIGSPANKMKKRSSGTFSFSRKQVKECFQDVPKRRKPFRPTDETIFKVYCADHSYTTLKLPLETKVGLLLQSTKEKLGLGEDLILCEVKSTGERIIFKDNDLCVTTGLSINGRLFVTPKEHLDALTPLAEQEGPTESTFSSIESFSSREMAYHLTTYDWELFTCVQEYELIYQVFGRYKFVKITANLDTFLQRFNEIQFWVVTEMVLCTNLSKRVSLLRKFIKLAAHCKEFQNLNSFFAIVMGLSNIAVSRLSQTWEKLPSKFKKMFADFETLMDPSRNHRVYRFSVAKMSPPIIPFMPLLMKDMTFTHEGNKTYFDGLVNFEKMHMISQTLKTVRFCRSAQLDIEAPITLKSSETSEYIRGLHVIDKQRLLTNLSHKLEPRKS